MSEDAPYRTFNNYLRETFVDRVYRVPIDAGFTCPNRDGARAFGGCTFCDDRGSGAPTIKRALSVKEQLDQGIDRIRYRFKAKKFLAYFQAFTNTYAPEGVLKELYDLALATPDVVGLCIGTRPDCLPDNVLDLLVDYDRRAFVWLEIGLQSAFNRTLEKINRGHTAEEFFDAVERAKKRGLKVAAHIIHGLPGESDEEMLETVALVAQTGIEAIKIHQLCIYKGTAMEEDFRRGELPMLDEDRYVDLVVRSLAILPPQMIVMRLVAEGSRNEVVAPEWCFEKERTLEKIHDRLKSEGIYQGKNFVQRSSAMSSAAPIMPA